MTTRSVEDWLREEYVSLFPSIRNTIERLETEVRYHLLPILNDLLPHERYTVESRIKECESAIDSLRRRQPFSIFDQDKQYTIKDLKDLVGIRILVFPRSLLKKVEKLLLDQFNTWKSDHVLGFEMKADPLALKYYGFPNFEPKITCEIQIVSMLTSLFWKVEHKVIYKPEEEFKGIANSLEMQDKTQQVLSALRDFEDTFESLLNQDKFSNRHPSI